MKKKIIDWDAVGLGERPDIELARELGVSDSTVWQQRKHRRISKRWKGEMDEQVSSDEPYCERCRHYQYLEDTESGYGIGECVFIETPPCMTYGIQSCLHFDDKADETAEK